MTEMNHTLSVNILTMTTTSMSDHCPPRQRTAYTTADMMICHTNAQQLIINLGCFGSDGGGGSDGVDKIDGVVVILPICISCNSSKKNVDGENDTHLYTNQIQFHF